MTIPNQSRAVVTTEAMRLRDACDKLDISERSAYRYCVGKVPPFHRAFRVGRSWRVPAEDLRRLLPD